MTMADTIAVMNGGRIEQLGSPLDLYEAPATAYVANFLGQSNLLPARVADRRDGVVLLDADGARLAVPADRCRSAGPDVLVGVRPEKVRLEPGGGAPSGANTLAGGVVTDAGFTGTSTQYLVRLPSGRRLTAFAQNTGRAAVLPVGTAVTACWDPAHTFALDGAQDAAAGTDLAEDTGRPAPAAAAG